jgi:hypothetical protein
MRFNRRSLFKMGALAGAAALSAPQIMTCAAFAAALPKPDVAYAGFHRFMLGDFEITTILDGIRPFDGPHPLFGADQNPTEVEALMEANFPPSRRMIGRTELILFDTGNGPEGRELGTNLANATRPATVEYS